MLPVRLSLLICFISGPLLIPAAVYSQNSETLDNLIFEPALIDPASKTVAPAPFSGNPAMDLAQGTTTYPYLLGKLTESEIAASLDDKRNPLEILEDIRSYQDQIGSLEGDEGPYSPELFQSLLDLGEQYQELGDHDQAIEVFERAEYVSRVNNGLFNPEQFASIEKSIESYIAMGDMPNAIRKQQYMLFLSEQYYGTTNLQTLPSIVSLAERNMTNFNRVVNMPPMPTFTFNMNTAGYLKDDELTPMQIAFRSLFQAQRNYYRAIGTMLDNREYFDPLLLNLEYRFLETIFLQAFRPAIMEDPDYYLSNKRKATGSLIGIGYNRRYLYDYSEGNNVFERLLIYIGNNPEAKAFQLVNTLLEYGDWNLLFSKGNTAMRKYRAAFDLMNEMDMEPETMAAVFRPDIPVHLPLFTAKPNSREKFGIPREAELDYAGYMDVTFTITRYGQARRINVVGGTENATAGIERRLKRYLRNSPFRPRLDDTGKSKSEKFTLRYYFTYAEQVPPDLKGI